MFSGIENVPRFQYDRSLTKLLSIIAHPQATITREKCIIQWDVA